MAPQLSILIVNWNTRDDLLACLASLREAAIALPHEVIVVDNASADGSADAVAERFPEYRLIRSGANLGFARGNNMALAEARGRYMLLLNPDTLVRAGELEKLVAYMEAEPQVGIVGPKLLYGDGSFQVSAAAFVEPWEVYWEFARFPRGLQPRAQLAQRRLYSFDTDQPKPVDYVIGAALLIRREVVERIGPLDPGYFMFGEEMDWCWRTRQAGWLVRWLPDAEVVHLGARATARVPYRMEAHRMASTVRFLRLHAGPRAALLTRALLAVGALQNGGLALLRWLARKADGAALRHELAGAGVILATALRGRAPGAP